MLARDVVCDSQIRGGQVISVPELKSSLLTSSWTQHTAHEFRKSADSMSQEMAPLSAEPPTSAICC